jgi:hypothetical protein
VRDHKADPTNEDRSDPTTRTRMDELTASWHEAVERLDRRYRLIAIRQTITSVLIVGLLIFGIAQRRRTDAQSQRNTHALCTLRDDLKDRVDRSDEFLATHPQGFAGISAAVLKQQTVGQKRTIKALEGLNCA